MHGVLPTSDPEPRALTRDGLTLSYTDEGEAGAPALIALHGVPGSVRDFRYLAPQLLPAVRVVRLDLPGFGGSPPHPEALDGFDGRARAVAALADALGLDRFAVLGHSMGGGTALVAAERYRERVSLLVLVSSVALRRHRGLGLPPAAFAALLQALAVPGLGRAVLALTRRAYRQRRFPGADRLTREEAAVQLRALAGTDFARLRGAVKSPLPPTLVAHADDDRLVESPVSEELARALPGATVLAFADGGHHLQKTRAPELARVIRERLAQST